jgi:hypothetical protein
MALKEIILSQYCASMEMFKNALIKSNNEIWYDDNYKNLFWRIAYHTLFYTDLYLSKDEKKFSPWEKHKKDYQFLGVVPWPPHNEPHITEPYEQPGLLEYYDKIASSLKEKIDLIDPESPSGFHWLPFSKFELQIYNIRHIQHHTGQLIDRIREKLNVGINWIGMRP